MGRYSDSTVYSFGKARGASGAPLRIKEAIDSGQLSFDVRVLQASERLDNIAGDVYGDSTLWWVIAAASGIGWGLQVPPGTRVIVPDTAQLRRII